LKMGFGTRRIFCVGNFDEKFLSMYSDIMTEFAQPNHCSQAPLAAYSCWG